MKKKLVILSGAGISAESGIKTFRDSEDGLWHNHNLEDVCLPSAWEKDPTFVNNFYNIIREKVLEAQPNKAHLDLAKAEEEFDIIHITQNVDDLFERAGCTNILHLHGQILKARSSNTPHTEGNPELFDVGLEGIQPDQKAPDGSLLRPHVVFFEEDVPFIVDAEKLVQECDAMIVVGTSLNVYPAAGLVWHTANAPVWLVDPNVDLDTQLNFPARLVRARASVGIEIALKQVKKYFEDKQSEFKA